MRFRSTVSRKFLPVLVIVIAIAIAGCRKNDAPDAYGNFEAEEVVVSAETSGQLRWFTPVEGARLAPGVVVGLVDTTQLALQAEQAVAQRGATTRRLAEAAEQIRVPEAQRDVARRAYERTQRLFEQQAATSQQLDQAEREYKVLLAQIDAAVARRRSVEQETVSSDAAVAQVRDRIAKSAIRNPHAGTVLATFVRAGEVVQPGQPLYRIANLDTLTLRAYVTETQLASIRLGQHVQVHVDKGNGKLMTVPGIVGWIASTAEFTPTPVQTRDERADLVYAVKVHVANPQGALKIGMPADLDLTAPKRST